MELVNHIVEAYAKKNTSLIDDVLTEIEEYTLQHHPHAHMLSGHVQGKVLEFFSCMVQPKNVLEIGTFTGFSALCLAKGLQLNGVLHTIELRDEDAKTAQQFFDKASVKNITLHTGNALQIIATLTQTWDLVFWPDGTFETHIAPENTKGPFKTTGTWKTDPAAKFSVGKVTLNGVVIKITSLMYPTTYM